ncbi:MAG TPA: hypothetical protein VFU07_05360 [Candidatus Lumbricidophila sp.]|nr:hypothetical protein [Candidatus Lumbricidophila sp.]
MSTDPITEVSEAVQASLNEALTKLDELISMLAFARRYQIEILQTIVFPDWSSA